MRTEPIDDATPAPHRQPRSLAASPGTSAATREALIEEHLKLADALARRYTGRGIELDDLRQVARCGLVEAVGRYDPSRGPFAAFAAPTITGGLKRYFRDHGWSMRPPREIQELAMDIASSWSDIAQDVGREPTTDDLAGALGRSAHDIALAQQARRGYHAATLVPENHPATGGSDPAYSPIEAKLVVDRALAELDPADRHLIHSRFWLHRTQSDVAAELGVSQMQVSRLLVRVLAQLSDLVGGTDDAPATLAATAKTPSARPESIIHRRNARPTRPRSPQSAGTSALRAGEEPDQPSAA